ncbi:MAG: TIM barrel protein [Candidatus Humimicrobiaceae bacterium]
MLKFGMHVFTWSSKMDNSALDYLKKLKKEGYEGCEIPLIKQRLDLIDTNYVVKRLKELDMDCITGAGLSEDTSIISDDLNIRNRGISYLKKCIDITEKLGGKLIAGALYGPIGVRTLKGRTKEQWEYSVKSLQKVARYAALKDITLCLEPLNRYEIFFANTINDVINLIKDIGESNVKLHIDTYHMNIEEKDFYQTVVKAGKIIGHVHCSENDRGIPGTGHVDWDGLFKALIEVNYDGWLVVESFLEPIPDIIEVTPIWRKLAPDIDTFTKESINFLKNKLVNIKALNNR